MNKRTRYSAEVRERSMRLVQPTIGRPTSDKASVATTSGKAEGCLFMAVIALSDSTQWQCFDVIQTGTELTAAKR